jgi:hypothetical protein
VLGFDFSLDGVATTVPRLSDEEGLAAPPWLEHADKISDRAMVNDSRDVLNARLFFIKRTTFSV